MAERRLIRAGDLSKKTGSTTVTIPVGGGTGISVFNVGGVAVIEMIVNVRITDTDPKVSDIYAPQPWFVTGTSIVGISLGGVTGTTVNMEVDVLGY